MLAKRGQGTEGILKSGKFAIGVLVMHNTGRLFDMEQTDKILKLKENIGSIISLTDDEFSLFIDCFEYKIIRKNDYFLEEGNVCNYIGFLVSGTMVYIKPGEDGDEITTDFAFEGDWVNSVLSRLSNSPSALSIKALEDSEILVLKQEDLNQLYFRIPKVERLGRIYTEMAFLRFVEQNIEFQVLSAKERYENLLKKHPEIFQKVQLYHIANYLGIAPKSLSRIRKEIFG